MIFNAWIHSDAQYVHFRCQFPDSATRRDVRLRGMGAADLCAIACMVGGFKSFQWRFMWLILIYDIWSKRDARYPYPTWTVLDLQLPMGWNMLKPPAQLYPRCFFPVKFQVLSSCWWSPWGGRRKSCKSRKNAVSGCEWKYWNSTDKDPKIPCLMEKMRIKPAETRVWDTGHPILGRPFHKGSGSRDSPAAVSVNWHCLKLKHVIANDQTATWQRASDWDACNVVRLGKVCFSVCKCHDLLVASAVIRPRSDKESLTFWMTIG